MLSMKLMFPWLLINMLFTMFPKIPFCVEDNMFALMVTLLLVTVLYYGIRHTYGGHHTYL